MPVPVPTIGDMITQIKGLEVNESDVTMQVVLTRLLHLLSQTQAGGVSCLATAICYLQLFPTGEKDETLHASVSPSERQKKLILDVAITAFIRSQNKTGYPVPEKIRDPTLKTFFCKLHENIHTLYVEEYFLMLKEVSESVDVLVDHIPLDPTHEPLLALLNALNTLLKNTLQGDETNLKMAILLLESCVIDNNKTLLAILHEKRKDVLTDEPINERLLEDHLKSVLTREQYENIFKEKAHIIHVHGVETNIFTRIETLHNVLLVFYQKQYTPAWEHPFTFDAFKQENSGEIMTEAIKEWQDSYKNKKINNTPKDKALIDLRRSGSVLGKSLQGMPDEEIEQRLTQLSDQAVKHQHFSKNYPDTEAFELKDWLRQNANQELDRFIDLTLEANFFQLNLQNSELNTELSMAKTREVKRDWSVDPDTGRLAFSAERLLIAVLLDGKVYASKLEGGIKEIDPEIVKYNPYLPPLMKIKFKVELKKEENQLIPMVTFFYVQSYSKYLQINPKVANTNAADAVFRDRLPPSRRHSS